MNSVGPACNNNSCTAVFSFVAGKLLNPNPGIQCTSAITSVWSNM